MSEPYSSNGRAFGMNLKVGSSNPPRSRHFLSGKNFSRASIYKIPAETFKGLYYLEKVTSKYIFIVYGMMYGLEWETVDALTRGLFWYLYPLLLLSSGNEQQNNDFVRTWSVCLDNTYIILFLTWLDESINAITNDDLYISTPCLTHLVYVLLMTSQSIADDITNALSCNNKYFLMWYLLKAILGIFH